MSEPSPRVALAHGSPMVRAGLQGVLEADGLELVAASQALDEVVGAARDHRADVLLLAADLAEDVAAVVDALPGCAVILLTDDAEVDRLLGFVAAGAQGVLLAGAEPARIPFVVRRVAEGEAALPGKVVRAMADDLHRRHRAGRSVGDDGPLLTHREYDVLVQLGQGLSVNQVANKLGIAPATVRRHAANATHKLGAPDRSAAVRLVRAS